MSAGTDTIGFLSWKEDDYTAAYVVRLSACQDVSSIFQLSENTKIYGQFSSVKKNDDLTYEAIRDPLGIGKLFYTEIANGEFVFSERFTDLFHCKSRIYSIPAGLHVRLGPGGQREIIKDIQPGRLKHNTTADGSNASRETGSEREHFRTKLQNRLDKAFSLIKKFEDAGWRFFVALSGGLDSSIIANYSVRFLSSPIACTLNLGASEDAEKSSLIARELGIQHLLFETSEQEILKTIDQAPLLCQDYRDFNVHCAVVNLLLAKNIKAWVESRWPQETGKIIVLTGDLMNEYCCDYEEEVIDDTVYYSLPSVGKKELQTYLIRGIDTSDRELLPFRHYGLQCIQPYAAVFDLYANLPAISLQAPDAKKDLNSFLVPPRVRNIIPEVKLRAQVGSKTNMGVLGLCHRAGLNSRYYRDKLLLDQGATAKVPIFVGKYDGEKFTRM